MRGTTSQTILGYVVRPLASRTLRNTRLRTNLSPVAWRADPYAFISGWVCEGLLGTRWTGRNAAPRKVISELRACTSCCAGPGCIFRVIPFGAKQHTASFECICIVVGSRRALTHAQVGGVVCERSQRASCHAFFIRLVCV